MIELKEFKEPDVEVIALKDLTKKYAVWCCRDRMGQCICESLESTVKRLILFCDSFASAGQVIEVKTNFDKNQFLDAIRVNRPYIISVIS